MLNTKNNPIPFEDIVENGIIVDGHVLRVHNYEFELDIYDPDPALFYGYYGKGALGIGVTITSLAKQKTESPCYMYGHFDEYNE